ncbi:MAG: LysM peptidoglycan-binding domain-containing protein [Deltaproteobacteria bacterium]|nr:LysM peptidoglycan-binding domain-containing protein [Deltaproteobacteria bacterium]
MKISNRHKSFCIAILVCFFFAGCASPRKKPTIPMKEEKIHIKARKPLKAVHNQDIQKYIWHIIKKGETLSKISKTFYGNFNQSSIIARMNNIKDAARIRAGMKIKIPELKKYPFIKQAGNDGQDTNTSMKPEKKADPKNKDSMANISKTHYQLGLEAFKKRKFLDAIENFQTALTFNKNCSPCKNMITKSRNLYKERHYKSGMKLYDEQNLNLAILEWELVQKMDPEYKKITELLNQAKTIQKNIKAIKQSE